MATNRSRSPISATKTRRSCENTLKNSTKKNFRIQSAPPLSIQHYVRYASGVITGGKEWKPTGKYRPPPFRYYVSPETRKQPKLSEPVWHLPGPYRDKRPASLSPEKRKEKTVQEPIWRPPGKHLDKPVPYFDPPSLRWSVQQLLRSMPATRSQSLRTSSSMSTSRKSKRIQEI